VKRWKRRVFIVLCIFFCLAVFAYLTKTFWRQQLRIYILGRIEVAAEDYGIRLPQDIDAVEVFTLGYNPNRNNTNGFVGDYAPCGTSQRKPLSGIIDISSALPSEVPIGTLGHKTLTKDDAAEVVDLWRHLPVGRDFQAMCFDPVYGLQFKRKGNIYFQTSVCWDCSGYTLPIPPFGTVQYGFDAKSKEAQKLLKVLEHELPLPPVSKITQP
jgi:hypothetical protein